MSAAPPRLPWPLGLAIRLLPNDVREEVVGELLARYRDVRDRKGAAAATAWAWRQPAVALAARLRWDRSIHTSSTGGRMFVGLKDDAVLALRGMRRRRGLALAIVSTIAISVAAIGAIASVIDAVLLRPLPYAEPDRLVWLNGFERTEAPSAAGAQFNGFANPLDAADWAARAPHLDAVTSIEGYEGTIETGVDPLRVIVAKLSASVGRVLGIHAEHGRLFTEADYGEGVRSLVLTHRIWQSAFGADPSVVGRALILDGTAWRVVGVLPMTPVPFPDAETDVWVPLLPPPASADPNQRGGVWQSVVARMQRGVTLETVRADMDRVAAALGAAYPATNSKRGIAVVPLRDGLVGSTRDVLVMLGGAIVIVLAIASANVGHLLLVSVQARRREFAVRAALGARASRVARLVLIESAALAILGGAVGLLIAPWLLRVFLSAYPADLPASGPVVLSPLALAVSLAATCLAALVAAVPPILGARSTKLSEAMRATDRGSDSRGQRRTRAMLVLGQVALSTALLVGGALLVRTFWEMSRTPLGFQADGLLTFNVSLAPARYPSPGDETRFYGGMFERLRGLPGVSGAGATTLLPLTPGEYRDGFYRVGSADKFPDVPRARLQGVTAGYLEAMGFPLVAGRSLQDADREGGAYVLVVNETLQRAYFPEGAVGRQIRFRGKTREIVGVVGDKRHRNLRVEPEPDLFVPRTQLEEPRGFSWVVVRHAGSAEPSLAAIRRAVRDVDPAVAIAAVASMSERVDRTLAPDRFRAFLVGALAIVALLLAVVGLYGLVAFAVARDARDTAIRVALGATSSQTAGIVLRRVLILTAAGVAVGVALALASQELLATFVAGVTVSDPLTMAIVGIGLMSVAALAAAGPALRASRVDPALVLRGQ